jgi:hypothetical protein
MSTAV